MARTNVRGYEVLEDPPLAGIPLSLFARCGSLVGPGVGILFVARFVGLGMNMQHYCGEKAALCLHTPLVSSPEDSTPIGSGTTT